MAAFWCSPGLASRSLDEITWVVIDIETTGLDPARHRLREFAALIVGGQGEVESSHAWVDGGGSGELAACLGSVSKHLDETAVIIAHNIAFDAAFLAASREGIPQQLADPPAWVCSMRLTGGASSLDELSASVGVQPVRRHTAMGDATTLASILQRLLALARDGGLRDVEALATVCALGVRDTADVAQMAGWSELREQLDHVVPIPMVSREQRDAVRRIAVDLSERSAPHMPDVRHALVEQLRAKRITASTLDLILVELDYSDT